MFTVATRNLENLYRPGGVFGPNTDDLYRSKLRQLAATITSIGPDVLAVQEVSQPEALADLGVLLAGRWYTTLSAHPDVRGSRWAVDPPQAVGPRGCRHARRRAGAGAGRRQRRSDDADGSRRIACDRQGGHRPGWPSPRRPDGWL